VKGDNPQISTGDHAQNIQAQMYVENQTIQQMFDPDSRKTLHQLPSLPLDFVGREKELSDCQNAIQRGVTVFGIFGMGGMGKTVLGLKMADLIIPRYPRVQVFIDLRGVHENQQPLKPAIVMDYVIRSFYPDRVKTEEDLEKNYQNGKLISEYKSALYEENVLIFLDNVLNAEQITSLIPPKNCFLIITSRNRFALPGMHNIDVDALSHNDAQLLVQTIAKTVTDKESKEISELCGYLPLAIRVATSILVTHSNWNPSKLIDSLRNRRTRFGLIDASLRLSYNDLDHEQQKRFRQLSVAANLHMITNYLLTVVWRAGNNPVIFFISDLFRKILPLLFYPIILLIALLAHLASPFNTQEQAQPIIGRLSDNFFEVLFWKLIIFFLILLLLPIAFICFVAILAFYEIEDRKEKWLESRSGKEFQKTTDATLDTFISASLISYDKESSRYRIHDLVLLFAEELTQPHLLERYYLGRIQHDEKLRDSLRMGRV